MTNHSKSCGIGGGIVSLAIADSSLGMYSLVDIRDI